MGISRDWEETFRSLMAQAMSVGEDTDEGQVFVRRAFIIAKKHSIDVAKLGTGNDKNTQVMKTSLFKSQWGHQKAYLYVAIADNMNCYIVTERQRNGDKLYYLFGSQENWKKVETLYSILAEQMLRDMNNAEIPEWDDPRSFKVSFMYGFANSIASRMREADNEVCAESTGNALVLASQSQKAKAAGMAHFGKVRSARNTRRASSYSGYTQGKAAGQKADMNGDRTLNAEINNRMLT